jgi:hypothetical protein
MLYETTRTRCGELQVQRTDTVGNRDETLPQVDSVAADTVILSTIRRISDSPRQLRSMDLRVEDAGVSGLRATNTEIRPS